MHIRIFTLLLVMVSTLSLAQEIQTNADKLFYGYAYEDAIRGYQKQMEQGQLMTNHQLLNLADSFFKTGNFRNASRYYLDVYKKDSIMSNNRFNNMLQSLAKTSEPERVKAFLKSNSFSLANELMENASFNYELLESNTGSGTGISIFDVNGNSPQSDFSPAFYKDRLLFSSGRKHNSKSVYGPSGESYLDIYVARIANTGLMLDPTPFDLIPKSKYHTATPYFSEALNRIFYVASNVKEGELSFDEKGKNTLSIVMVYEDGRDRYVLKDQSTSFYYPFFEDTTGKLYFAANFPEGYGGTDIYYVHTSNSQVMSEPHNLGPRINTPGNEIAPFIFDNSLYFSSDVFYGFGGMDIYKSHVLSDGSYSIPVNLGIGLNSELDDFGFIIRANKDEGYMGYFASNRKGGKGNDDIYGFKTENIPGLKTFAIRGKVANLNSNRELENAQVSLFNGNRTILKEVTTDKDGNYRIEVPWQDQVTIRVTKDRYSVFTKSYDTQASMEEAQEGVLNIEMAMFDDLVEVKEDKTVLKLKSFFFVKDQSTVTGEMQPELDKVVEAISRFPQLQLNIESHTDSRGNDARNKQLSQKRADAIKLYLQEKGVPASNILSAVGYGEEHIINSCTNGAYCLDFLHKQNERTLFVVTNPPLE